MQNTTHLLKARRFLPLFVTQALGAFNDNFFKTAMVLYVTYQVYSDAQRETLFNALATGLFILPFFLLSAVSGQLADMNDKAKIIRIVKTAEIGIMLVGAVGLLTAHIPLMLVAVLAMGVHSTFFGPIKYAILPQHLQADEVLGGTGLIEAGTYMAILAGTIFAGFVADQPRIAAGVVLVTAACGWLSGREVPPAPPVGEALTLDLNVFRASVRLVSATMHIPRLFLAIVSISFFWTIGSVLIIIFPPLVKNVLGANEEVASLFLGIFSVGIAIGSVLINRLLKSEVSARYSPAAVIVMGLFVLLLFHVSRIWEPNAGGVFMTMSDFWAHDGAPMMILCLLGIAIAGGIFVVPLYAFLTTTVPPSETARTVAANNIVNAGAMVCGAGAAFGLTLIGFDAKEQLLLVAAMCIISAWLAHRLNRACQAA